MGPTVASVTVTDVRPAAPQEWDAAWSGCPYSTWFHSRAWAEDWREATGGRLRPQPLQVTFSDGRTALLPLSVRASCAGLLRSALSSPAGTYGGWISAAQLRTDHAGLLAGLLRRRFPRLVWRLNPHDPLAAAGGAPAAAPDDAQMLDLAAGFEAVHRGWTKGHRAAARQAQRAGVEVAPARARDDWRAYFGIYRDSLRRWGDRATSAHGWGIFEALCRRGEPGVRLWLARSGGRPVAGALCLYDARQVCYWHGAALESHFPERPVHLLLYEAIRDACARGLRRFDFLPSGGHEGVRAFKRSFGCEARPAPVVVVRPAWRRLLRRLRGS